MKSSEIRKKWLAFFASKGHHIEESASLVPHNDPSLLWINAGMAPLKSYFDGRETPENPRIANSQKCIRTNDIENVGKTRRHHTFFEMMGNFSIGDYFKEEVVVWAWEFLTSPEWIGFDTDKLSVTVFPDDEEAYKLWNDVVGLPADRIVKLEENFWDIGEGPCGPCTEIFYDRGEAFGDPHDPEMFPGGENERYLEIWNLVFSQFNHNKDGSYTPLPNKNIDTGAGLERFACVLQNTPSNFDTDLFQPIIQHAASAAGVVYGQNENMDIALKVIADHVRAVTFAVGDGVLPSNEGRGYVIRRLLRRAVRYGRSLGLERPFLFELVAVVGQIMGTHYKEIIDHAAWIAEVIRKEEDRFLVTLNDGLALLNQRVTEAKRHKLKQLSGDDAFKLYDTFGFPLDLTEDFALEHGLEVDREGFEAEMEAQRSRARAARQDHDSMQVQGGPLADLKDESQFIGYDTLQAEAAIIALFKDGQLVNQAIEGDVCDIVLDRTPFYAESGGQIADSGVLLTDGGVAQIKTVRKAPRGQHVHHILVQEGIIKKGHILDAQVNRDSREAIVRNHTATHLLQQALKDELGDHVQQAGSYVGADRLRFDFSHMAPVASDALQRIEEKVNSQIWENIALDIQFMDLEDAKASGAMALFGEKYGDTVRVVRVGDYSKELCGGCHVRNTAEIGLFKIISESGIGSGVRRIEAVSSKQAYQYLTDQDTILHRAAGILKSKPADLIHKSSQLMEQIRELQRQSESLRAKLSRHEAGELINQIEIIDDVNVLAVEVKGVSIDGLRELADEMKQSLESAVIVLGAIEEGKVLLVAAVTADLIKKGYHAGKLAKLAASVCGGGGGGRPDMAQAGGKDPAQLGRALAGVKEAIKSVAAESIS